MEKQRDFLMDNCKALLLFLVALGHTLDVFKESSEASMYIMKYLYLFHMPMFAFITGYFTKDLDKARSNAAPKSLIPYIFFQSIYLLAAFLLIKLGVASYNTDTFNGSLIVPSSDFYYLLAVFFWKLFAKDLKRIRFIIPFSVLFGVVISLTTMSEFHTGYGAVFSLLPFFVLGMFCTGENIEKIRRIPKLVAIVVLLGATAAAVFLPYSIHSVRMTYADAGFSNLEGILYRLAFYAIATLMICSVICLMSSKKRWFTHIGTSSILVYAGSTFLAPHLYVLIDKYLHISSNEVVNIIGMFVFSLLVVLFCSIPVFLKWYNLLMDKICKLIFKKSTSE